MNVLLALLWLFGDATTMVNAKGGLAFGVFTILHIVLSIAATGFTGLSGSIVIPVSYTHLDVYKRQINYSPK